jgi:hypothetical protein
MEFEWGMNQHLSIEIWDRRSIINEKQFVARIAAV